MTEIAGWVSPKYALRKSNEKITLPVGGIKKII